MELIMLILNKHNDVLGWQDSHGVDIFFQQQRIGENLRGGAFPCVPQFGSVPTKPGWGSVKLPQHGMWRLLNYGNETRTYTSMGCECQAKSYTQPEGYPFDFQAEERFRLSQLSRETILLEHSVTVLRSSKCPNDKLMPWMPGWHPYFATHGEPFEVWVGRTVPLTEDTPLDPAATYDFFGQPVKLLTKRHEIVFFFQDIKEVVVWTDNKKKYVCIEPVSLDYRLGKGGHSFMSSSIQVTSRTWP